MNNHQSINFAGRDIIEAELREQRINDLGIRFAEPIAAALFVTVVARYDNPDQFGVHLTMPQTVIGWPMAVNRTVGLFSLPDFLEFAGRFLRPEASPHFVYSMDQLPSSVVEFIIRQQVPMEWKSRMGEPEMAVRVCVYSQYDLATLTRLADKILAVDEHGRPARAGKVK